MTESAGDGGGVMGVGVAEYLGLRTDVSSPNIVPVRGEARCPFRSASCDKLTADNQPVCSVRKANGALWIACQHRLCSTSKELVLSSYQQDMLHSIAKAVFDPAVVKDELCVKREQRLKVNARTGYSADYLMTFVGGRSRFPGPDRLVVEMQGGGETSNTGRITRHILEWAANPGRTNSQLGSEVEGVGTIETNAWRRQQEQFIVKGNIAMKTWKGYGIAFCMGAPLFDYLKSKVDLGSMPDLHAHNWTLALVGISEDRTERPQAGPIPLATDPNRMLFTNYQTFVQALINQGLPSSEAFGGTYTTLTGSDVDIPVDQ